LGFHKHLGGAKKTLAQRFCVDKNAAAPYASSQSAGKGPAFSFAEGFLARRALQPPTAKKPARGDPRRAGLNTEKNDVRSDQDRRQAIPRRR
jgi:hypothetical protein